VDPNLEVKIYAIERPSSKLMVVYFIQSAMALLAFPLVFVPLWFKYLTLKYKFDHEGVSASWGVIFKRQVYLTYGRIQDIHLSRGLVERWLNLGTVDIQTASGSASAELSIVGLHEYDEIRDFLYSKMRGYKSDAPSQDGEASSNDEEALHLLREIRDEIKKINQPGNHYV
jgi:putative membrane protein